MFLKQTILFRHPKKKINYDLKGSRKTPLSRPKKLSILWLILKRIWKTQLNEVAKKRASGIISKQKHYLLLKQMV